MNIRSILLASLCSAMLASSALAQSFTLKLPPTHYGAQGIQGKVLVKLSPAAFQRGVTTAIFGDAVERYGIRSIAPWLNPKLVAFRLPMYKGSQAGAASEPAGLALRRIVVVEYSSLDSPEDVAYALGRVPGVEYAEPIYPRKILFTPNDTEAWRLWYLDVIKAKQA